MAIDFTALGTALLILLASEWILGHGLLFWALHFGANLPASAAVRWAHILGLGLGWSIAAAVPATSTTVDFWNAGSLSSYLLLALALVWLLVVAFAPPGFSGPRPRQGAA